MDPINTIFCAYQTRTGTCGMPATRVWRHQPRCDRHKPSADEVARAKAADERVKRMKGSA